MTRFIAFDPGGVTGVARYAPDGAVPFASYEVANGAPGMFASLSRGEGGWLGEYGLVIIESFTINAATHRKDPAGVHAALNIIGALQYECTRHRVPFVLRSPSGAKAFATDDKLRKVGWWNPSVGGHANDAARHLLTWLTKNRHEEILNALR